MLRAKRKKHPQKQEPKHLYELENRYGFRQTLLHLRQEEEA
jgi:hypothetical protein